MIDPTPGAGPPAPRTPPVASALRRPLGTALVRGPSMLPALADGDCLLVRRGAAGTRAGDVVVARFPQRPELLVVKRAVRPVGRLWWVEGDNAAATDDSRRYGPAEVLARVVLRWWPPSRWGAVPRHGPEGLEPPDDL